MSLLRFRKDRIDQLVAGKYAPSQATVTSYRAGGTVNGNQTSTTITIRRGHRFPAAGGVKLMVMRYSGSDWAMVAGTMRTVSSSTDTTVVLSLSLTVLDGDYLVNIGNDTGSTVPNFDASPVLIHRDPEGKTASIAASSVTPNTKGDFWYFTREDRLWDVVHESTSPLALILDTIQTEGTSAIRFADMFATSGTGERSDPFVRSGGNCVQAALDDLPSSGGTVLMVGGYFNLGNASVAVNIPILANGLDRRQYVFRGAGRDLTFLNYTGTGSAFRYAQVAIGVLPEVASYQSNQLVFEDFAVCQTGTLFTGSAFYMTYINESIFRNLTIGTPRVEGGPAAVPPEPGSGFQYGIRLENSTPGQNVVDFNRIDNCLINGNQRGVYAENQADNLMVTRSWFQPDLSATGTTFGMEIHNSRAFIVEGNHFNYYGAGVGFTKSGTGASFGLKLSGYYSGANVISNYFENNPVSIWSQTDHASNQKGAMISGNSISFTATTNSTGILIGILAGAFRSTGIVIAGNGFFGISATNEGIRINDDCRDFTLLSNGYDNTGGTDRTLQTGCVGRVFEAFGGGNQAAMMMLIERDQLLGRVRLQNTNASPGESPRLEFYAGGGQIGAIHLTAAGAFQFIDASGIGRWSVAQNGDMVRMPLSVGATSPVYTEGTREELVTIAPTPATTTDTTIDLPANSEILSVTGRVVVAIPTAATFAVGDNAGSANRFATGVSTALGTQFVGILHLDSAAPAGKRQTAPAKVRITVNLAPATNVGRVRVVVNYRTYTAPTTNV